MTKRKSKRPRTKRAPKRSASKALVAPSIRVLAVKHLLSEDVHECACAYGMTLEQILGAVDGVAATVGGVPVERDRWQYTRPLPGDVVTAVPVPRGDDVKTIIGVIALAAAAFYGGIGAASLFSSSSVLLSSASMWSGAIYAVGATRLNLLAK